MRSRFCALTALMAASVSPANAEPGGTSSVTGPGVAAGALEFEARTAYFGGDARDGSWAHRAHVNYGVNDWWRFSLIARGGQAPGEAAELRSLGVSNVFDFTATRAWPVRLGGQVQYRYDLHDAPGLVTLKLLAERQAGDLTSRLNLIAEREVGGGASDEWSHSYAARFMWRTSDAVALGVEGFDDVDVGARYWGPRIELSAGAVRLTAAYLAGMGAAEADGQLRLTLGYAR
ncbi:MAG: hypothetical protein HXY28_03080 [Hydrogenophilaceae bacterium]|nr:hypothetical protein [Hydrogenophilaceae bacterium]